MEVFHFSTAYESGLRRALQGHLQSPDLRVEKTGATGCPWAPAVVFLMTQSMANRKRIGDMMHSCLKLDSTVNHSEDIALTRTLHLKC